ncbi:MAG: helix-turn-helix transcriptional regulator [Spirochaetes bacterium]|nr:helix-turn-helix transcriptional regulator [Spirochaetota bacterium]
MRLSFTAPVSIFLIAVLFFLPPAGRNAFAATMIKTLDGRTSLAGKWKIIIGDDIKFASPEFDDSSWREFKFPASVMRYFIDETGTIKGIFWLRKTVTADRDLPREDIGLILGRIGNADETYFNGEKIGGLGEFPPGEFSMWNHPRYYMIPRSLVRYGGKNVIAVRVSCFVFSEMLGELALTNRDDWAKSRTLNNFFLVTLNYIIIAMGVPIFLIFFFFYIRRRSSQEYLFYCLQLVCGLVIILELCSYWDLFGSQVLRLKFLGLAWVAINVFHPIFLHRIYELKRKKIEAALWLYLVFIIILLFTITGKTSDQMQALVLIGITTPIGLYNISCHITALIRKSPYAKLFSFFGITVIMGAIHDGIIYLSKFTGYPIVFLGYSFPFMIFPYTAALLYTGTTLVLVSRFIGMMDEIEDLNTSLENFVIENALLSDRLKEAPVKKKQAASGITSQAEEKIRKVKEYIQDNFRSDISREGLAASIDVHPDNLGKLFKTCTSQKLGDYIYELRTTEAAKQLIETDNTIIDIAFSVGFESLRTFNRIFPKFMGMTPEKYRRMNKKSISHLS